MMCLQSPREDVFTVHRDSIIIEAENALSTSIDFCPFLIQFSSCLTAISYPVGPQTFPLKVAGLITPLILLYFTQISPHPPTSISSPPALHPSITYSVIVPVSCSFALIIGISYDILSQYRDIFCEILLDRIHSGR